MRPQSRVAVWVFSVFFQLVRLCSDKIIESRSLEGFFAARARLFF